MTQSENQSQDTAMARDYSAARKAMIDSQLRTSGVNDYAVLGRMGSVAREDFIPASAAAAAYQDRALLLEDGGVIGSPLFYGMLLAEAQPHPQDQALIVDGGSGYLAALIEPMVAGVSVIPAADAAAMQTPPKGEKGAYSLLLIDGAVETVPEGLAACLADGGRLAGGLADGAVERLVMGRAAGGKLDLLPVADIGIHRLKEFDVPKGWTF